jgi:hypothetical protein
VVDTCPGVVLYYLLRRHWPSRNPEEENPGSLLWPHGILVCHISSISVLRQFQFLLKVLDYTPISHGANMPGIHVSKCLALRAMDTYPFSILTACFVCVQEWMSASFSFILYVVVFLRVRGNLIQDTAGKWSLRWVSRNGSWQLAFARDYLDSCLVKMAAITVWYA